MMNIPKLGFIVCVSAVVVTWAASDLAGLANLAEESRRVHSAKKSKVSAGEVTLPREPNGHFFVEAEVNGTNIKMLADTGASYVTLGEDAAESIGLDPDSLDYTGTAQTANGTTQVAQVDLDEIRVGSIVRRDVRAFVARDMSGALLGMSFFNTLSKVSIERDELVLND